MSFNMFSQYQVLQLQHSLCHSRCFHSAKSYNVNIYYVIQCVFTVPSLITSTFIMLVQVFSQCQVLQLQHSLCHSRCFHSVKSYNFNIYYVIQCVFIVPSLITSTFIMSFTVFSQCQVL